LQAIGFFSGDGRLTNQPLDIEVGLSKTPELAELRWIATDKIASERQEPIEQ